MYAMNLKNLLWVILLYSITLAQDRLSDVASFVPKGFVLFEDISGDLNGDGVADRLLVVKGTDSTKFEDCDCSLGIVDRNRRGIILLIKKGNAYEVAVQNLSCFASENEDGGVYFAPELSLSIKKNKLYVDYSHGRYGSWCFTFRYRNADLELIGYDMYENRGPITETARSLNFLTNRMKVLFNTTLEHNLENGGKEKFEETWSDIRPKALLKLSEIRGVDLLYFSDGSLQEDTE